MVLAAGLSSRYGALKQLDEIGPGGHTLMDYAIYDAHRAGFGRILFVIRPGLEPQFVDRIERLTACIPSEYAFQLLEDLPRAVPLPPNRLKPWGTGHAVLAVRDRITGPFAVVNADDFYGRSSYVALREHWDAPATDPPTLALVGFRMDATLSAHGGVSRGVCEYDTGGFLTNISEVTELQEADGRINGVSQNGATLRFGGDEIVSTNIWGFTHEVFEMLATRLRRFLEVKASDPNAEFLIPDAINDIVATREARVKILPARERFFGITHPEDRPMVRTAIQDLIDSGCYPEKLFTH